VPVQAMPAMQPLGGGGAEGGGLLTEGPCSSGDSGHVHHMMMLMLHLNRMLRPREATDCHVQARKRG
jgi:hypothetical protein